MIIGKTSPRPIPQANFSCIAIPNCGTGRSFKPGLDSEIGQKLNSSLAGPSKW
ncbi:hypothetical protein CC2G_014809 [Coprinopsis cinerea AmutBmut pab1-1]|nr:hypothetical protein CC2G_014809 [Coprinopsis cinerea AmutBmut pab1-1]